MPPKQTSGARRGRPQGSTSRANNARESSDESSNPFDSAEDDDQDMDDAAAPPPRRRPTTQATTAANRSSGASGEPEKTIPRNLLTRVLHEFFEKDATRISRDANGAVGKYVDVFVREAIARAAVEKRSGFLEVEDLEKIAPQLLLDL
ncbi:hypothetical protein K4F52_000530 [Lecanicillium sp. MT-2017a]|nr:hypothetical protein K4F52_000530 [Lecanicillium sp. MT-2017a]